MAADNCNVLVVYSKKKIKKIRDALDIAGYYDNSRRIAILNDDDGSFGLPITSAATQELSSYLKKHRTLPEPFGDECALSTAQLPKSKKEVVSLNSEHKLLQDAVVSLLDEKGFRDEEKASLLLELPKSWEKHGDLLLLPGGCFSNPSWEDFGEALWRTVASSLKCSRLAIGGRITCDGFRSATAWLALGRDGWVEHVDNGIKYVFDITKCMFSSGNITEKLRIAKMDCSGETVVDLYAGIGYFTLPYLVHAHARLVHACEWNAHAVEALRRGLAANQVQDKCIVHFGDNRQVAPKGVADRVNLGLLPSSEAGWPVACAALRPDTGGWLHVHGNVCSKPGSEPMEHNPWEVTGSELRMGHGRSGREGPKPSSGTPILKSEIKAITSEVLGGLGSELVPTNCLSLVQPVNSPTEKVAVTVNQDCPESNPSCGGKHLKRFRVWEQWAVYVAGRVRGLLTTEHPLSYEGHHQQWKVVVKHIEHVKSYAPHVDHIVVDIECRPASKRPDLEEHSS